jgi:hypothetical protein
VLIGVIGDDHGRRLRCMCRPAQLAGPTECGYPRCSGAVAGLRDPADRQACEHGGQHADATDEHGDSDPHLIARHRREEKDTINVGPGERFDVIWPAREPGLWLLHCHINQQTTNDNVEEEGAGGLILVEVSP